MSGWPGGTRARAVSTSLPHVSGATQALTAARRMSSSASPSLRAASSSGRRSPALTEARQHLLAVFQSRKAAVPNWPDPVRSATVSTRTGRRSASGSGANSASSRTIMARARPGRPSTVVSSRRSSSRETAGRPASAASSAARSSRSARWPARELRSAARSSAVTATAPAPWSAARSASRSSSSARQSSAPMLACARCQTPRSCPAGTIRARAAWTSRWSSTGAL
jgi:hypothetical protein